MSKNIVRLGIVGVGGMGGNHARNVLAGKVDRCELTAVCDVSKDALAKFPQAKQFVDSGEMARSGTVDAILVATPHYFHVDATVSALQAGLHVMVEKPMAVHKADCEKMIAAHKDPKQVFAIMYQFRTEPVYVKLKKLIESGELGKIQRINWIVTTWFRSDCYYASAGWRASWKGEGGGILINQCPHNIDIFQWLFGMPDKVRAFCRIGRYHNIEVEDDVTAYMEYKNGPTAVLVASTGEAPGTDRLEVATDMGRILVEPGTISFTRNEVPVSEYCRTSETKFDKPPTWEIKIPCPGKAGLHSEILTNFTSAILDGKPLVSPAREGIRTVELINAMIYSSFKEETVEFPLDSAAYEELLKSKIEESEAKRVRLERNGKLESVKV